MTTNPKEKPTRAISREETEQVHSPEQERLALRRAYAQLFSGEVGKVVLDDLLRRYGWREGVELASYRVGMGHADMAFVEGQKEVVRYVLTQTGGMKPNNQGGLIL